LYTHTFGVACVSKILTCMRAYILCIHILMYTDRFVRIHIEAYRERETTEAEETYLHAHLYT